MTKEAGLTDLLFMPSEAAHILGRYGRDVASMGKNTIRDLLPALTKRERAARAAQKALAEAPLPTGEAARFANPETLPFFRKAAGATMYYKLGTQHALADLGIIKHAWGPARGPMPPAVDEPMTPVPTRPTAPAKTPPTQSAPQRLPTQAPPPQHALNRTERGLRNAGLRVPGR
jgi:hypothetical protein